MAKWQSGITKLVISQPEGLTNRQVADKLNIPIKVVADARRRNGLPHNNKPRKQGISEQIVVLYKTGSAASVARQIGCSVGYVQNIWRQIERVN